LRGACERKERGLYVLLEQSPEELMRNMRTVGLSLNRYARSGMLEFHALRPTAHGLELHLTTIHDLVERLKPQVVVVDAISSFISMGVSAEVTSMIVRLIDYLKTKGITLYLTSLNEGGEIMDKAGASITSVVDTWLLLRNMEANGSRVRTISVLKSRGMAHSNATQQFVISRKGVALQSPLISQATA
jgi:circadian clock protein KaiC